MFAIYIKYCEPNLQENIISILSERKINESNFEIWNHMRWWMIAGGGSVFLKIYAYLTAQRISWEHTVYQSQERRYLPSLPSISQGNMIAVVKVTYLFISLTLQTQRDAILCVGGTSGNHWRVVWTIESEMS